MKFRSVFRRKRQSLVLQESSAVNHAQESRQEVYENTAGRDAHGKVLGDSEFVLPQVRKHYVKHKRHGKESSRLKSSAQGNLPVHENVKGVDYDYGNEDRHYYLYLKAAEVFVLSEYPRVPVPLQPV